MYILQISCMVILSFLLVLFLSERKFQKGTHKLYIALIIISILELVFEGLTIYSVHRVNEISPILFKTINRSYLTLVLTYFYLGFRYKSAFVREETGMPDRGLVFIHVAQAILYAGIFLLPLGYEETGNGARFDYGPGMWIVYVGAAFYLFVIFSNYVEQMRRIDREKLLPLVLGIGCGMVICFYYMCNPSTNIAGLALAIMGIAMYISMHESDREIQETKDCEMCREKQPDESEIQKVSFRAPQAQILVVDDSEMNRKVLRKLLEKSEMQVEEASGGKECLELIRRNKYQLILMDHLMPEMDGLETFEIIKKEHLCDDIPVVVMTANALSMAEEDYLSLGFAAYIAKPISPEKLDLLIYRLLDKAWIVAVKTEKAVAEEKNVRTEEAVGETEMLEDWKNLPAVNGLDYDYAGLHFKSPSEFTDTIQFLVEVMRSDMKELQSYYNNRKEEQELHKFCTKVHSMKNSAMTVGIVPLAGLAKTLEDASRDKDDVQVSALMPIFEEKWEAYRLLLNEKFGVDNSQKVSADPHSEEITALFQSLREAAEVMDIDALDEIMKQIDTYAFEPEYEEKLQRIRQAVMNFDVDYLQEEGYL